MKVLHVAPSLDRRYGGPTEALCGFLQASRAAGIDVEVLAPRGEADEAAAFAQRVADVPMHLHRSHGSGGLVFSAGLLSWLHRHHASFDVIHVHGLLNPVSSLAARVARAGGRPFVIRPFGTLSRYTFSYRRGAAKRLYFRALDRPNIEAASAVHFTTTQECDEAQRHSTTLGSRAHVIPPPCGGVAAHPRAATDCMRGARVLFVSRLHPVKNLEALIEGWSLVSAALPGGELLIVGEGDPAYVDTLRELVVRRGVSGSVRFCGFLTGEDKRRAYESADLFVLPSHHESFGISAVEAMAAGLPVVLSTHVQLAGFVRSHGLGLVVAGSPGALSTAILQALGDAELRRRCAGEGSALIEGWLSPAAIGSQLAEMYATITH